MTPLVVWRFSDGKAGHDNQSRGLIDALSRLRPINLITLEPQPASQILAVLLRRAVPDRWQTLSAPDLLVGAGHGTHLPLLLGRWFRGGRVVVLMRPSLPLSWFDLCLIPSHDAPPARANVVTTQGALNRIQPSSTLKAERGLVLIGGPSAHFGWDSNGLNQQIAAIVTGESGRRWTLTTSRRTPAHFLSDFTVTSCALTVVPVTDTGPDWLPEQLARSSIVWVTADSVSMIYEALTAGARVGILDLPSKRPSRISRGLTELARQGWVSFFTDWVKTAQLSRPSGHFNEAERCAREISSRWFA